ncbi:hypothetical protein [Micromonospora sp. CPCC 206061]|uniref:hypothetical protein n=1 Tax=Micromonospora sp. CPCC 206061 TaxID=3122410 RepID=UPI002FF39EFF
MRLLIIGGSDAGISAGLRARELDPDIEVTLLVADRYPNFSICGIPYHITGDVPDWRNLAHRSLADLEHAGLRLRLDHQATAIDPTAHTVTVATPTTPAPPPSTSASPATRRTGRLLGAQLLGHITAQIAKRIDIYATAISYGATVRDIADLDPSYTPPLSSPWDAVQLATITWRQTHTASHDATTNCR